MQEYLVATQLSFKTLQSQTTSDLHILNHITQLAKVVVELAIMNDPIRNGDKTSTLLQSLPTFLSIISFLAQATSTTYTDICAILSWRISAVTLQNQFRIAPYLQNRLHEWQEQTMRVSAKPTRETI